MKVNFKSKKTRVLLIVAAIVLVLALLIGKAVSSISSAVSGFDGMVEVVEVEQRDLSETITLSGTVQGISSTNVTSKAAAKFTEVNVSVGDEVQEGDVLACLDSSDIDTQINQTGKSISNTKALTDLTNQSNAEALARAQEDQATALASAKTALDRQVADYEAADAKYSSDKAKLEAAKSAKSAYDTAKKNYEDKYAAYTANNATPDPNQQAELDQLESAMDAAYATYLAKLGGSSIEAMEAQVSSDAATLSSLSRACADAKTAYDNTVTSTNRSIDAAQDAINASQYQTADTTASDTLKELKDQKNDCVVYAPCSGVVTAVKVSVGDNNTPGATIITIQDTSTLVISSIVDESDILKLEEGMKASVTTKATGEETMEGTLTRVTRVKSEPGADGTSGYETEITLDNTDLLIGMTAKARIVLHEKKNVLSVPYDLIQYDEDGNAFVMAAEDNGDGSGMATVVRKNVQVGEEINYYTEIIGGDLKEGDQIFFDTAVEEGASVFPYSQWDDVTEE
ncbi:MAG: efflux RND transporter periplasmic adaptor subunit [Lachnospiraceae bacterium]|nr:efflux RND transporter periplasmic adaptor subunit [Lachnospiraceae bacterium]